MYSLVLMMALNGSADVAGASPVAVPSVRTIGSQELYRGHRGGCYGCYGCYGGCYGCWGGCYGCYGGCYGCYGGYAGAYYYGGMRHGGRADITPVEPQTQMVAQAAPARIQVELPANATLTVDDTPTQSTSANRTFVSPALEPGMKYHYTLKATLVRNGETLEITKRVPVEAGRESRVVLDFNDESQVARR
jgi:uncharacterized protein (TIGR03000 family)